VTPSRTSKLVFLSIDRLNTSDLEIQNKFTEKKKEVLEQV